MKKISILLSLILIAGSIFAQTSKRVSAHNYLKDGDLDLAKEAIDKCVVHSKTSKDPRAWLYYGQIYYAISVSKDKVYKNLDAKSELKSFEGLKNALLFNFKNSEMHSLDIENQLDLIKLQKAFNNKETQYVDRRIFVDIFQSYFPNLSGALVNKGLRLYQEEKKYDEALQNFEKSLFTSSMIGKADTNAIYLCALASVKAKKIDKAIEYYKVLAEMGYGKTKKDKANNYYFLAKQYLNKQDTVHYLKTLSKGIKRYPKSSGALVVENINYYILKGQKKEALEYLEKGIEVSPKNAMLYYNKGIIYDNDSALQDKDKAIEAYKKTIELDSTYFDAYYSLGALYFNQGAAKNDEANNVDPDNFKKYKTVKAQADAIFKKALPYLEKAHQLKPKDMPTMQSLKLIYYRTGNLKKHDAIKAEMGL